MLEEILNHGLRPPRPRDTNHDWVWDLSGRFHGNAEFLSTASFAGQGGDPVSFTMGWPMKRLRGSQPGYIIVVDLPHEALDLIDAIAPNIKLDTFIGALHTRRFLRGTFHLEGRRVEQDASEPLATWNLSNWLLYYWMTSYCANRAYGMWVISYCFRSQFCKHCTNALQYRYEWWRE